MLWLAGIRDRMNETKILEMSVEFFNHVKVAMVGISSVPCLCSR